MKKIMLFTVIGLLSLTSNVGFAQDSSMTASTKGPNFAKLDASPMDLIEYTNPDKEVVARIIYSRPQKRDRQVFGKLVPYGEVWRTGANESTELTLYKDVKISNHLVKAGTYTIYTIPQEHEWTIILNNSVHTWGAYEYTDKKDLVRIKVPVKQSNTTIESFSMAFAPTPEGASLYAGWDDKYVEVPFTKAK